MLRIQLAGTSCDNIDTVAHDPHLRQFTYPQLWRNAALFFLPRWCGSPDQLRKFAEYAADSTKNSLGQSLYALIAWDTVAQERSDRQALSAYRFDWPRIRQGFLDLLDRYPDALLMYQRFAYLAQFFEDRATARMIFAKPQAVWSTAAEEVWGVRDDYDVARRWADTQPAQTFVNGPGAKQSHGTGVAVGDESTSWIAGGASKWPPLFLVNDVKTSDGLQYLFNSFLVRSNSGIVGITALTKFGKQQTYTSGSGKQAIFVTAISRPFSARTSRTGRCISPAKRPSRFSVFDRIESRRTKRYTA